MLMIIRGRDLSVTAFIVIALVIVGVVFGVTRKPHVSIPPLTDVRSIQMAFHSTSPDPNPILADSSQGKADIAQLLQWMESAKSMGYEQSPPFGMSMGPTGVVIKLDNHKGIAILEAFLTATFTEPNGQVGQESKRSNVYVDVQSSDNTKWIRYYSPQLSAWLNRGWQQDWNWK